MKIFIPKSKIQLDRIMQKLKMFGNICFDWQKIVLRSLTTDFKVSIEKKINFLNYFQVCQSYIDWGWI